MSVAVIGNGAWGEGLARLVCRAGGSVVLWGRRSRSYEGIGVAGGDSFATTEDLASACSGARHVIIALPSSALVEVCGAMRDFIVADISFISAVKGMVSDGLELPSEFLRRSFSGSEVCVLSGPNFATEIIAGFPAAAVIAGDDGVCVSAMSILGSRNFRLYRGDSAAAIELCGIMKNVIAIACGVCVGLELGENARSALLTRGLAEMRRFIGAFCEGADIDEALLGLAGVGDLSLTCSSLQSRNMALGYALARGASVAEALAQSKGVCEGVGSCSAILAVSRERAIDVPITAAVSAIINGESSISAVVDGLLGRPFR